MDKAPDLNIQELLRKYDLLSAGDAVSVNMEARNTGRDFKDIVIEKGLVSEDALFYAISTELNLPFVTLEPDAIDRELVRLIPQEVMEKNKFLPMIEVDGEIRVAVADPTDRGLLEFLRETFPDRQVSISVALSSNIMGTIASVFAEQAAEPEMATAKTPAIAIFYSALTKAVLKGASALYIEAVDKQLRIRKKLRERLVTEGTHPVDSVEPVIQKIREMVNMECGSSGSIKTTIAGKEVFVTARIISGTNCSGSILEFRYPVKKRPLKDFPVPQEYEAAVTNALSMGKGLILVTGKDKDFREALAQSLLMEFNPERRKVVALLREEEFLPELEYYVAKDAEDLNTLIAAVTDAGVDTLYMQDIRDESVNISRILQLAENTTVIASLSTVTGKDGIAFIDRRTPELRKENRYISAVLETGKDPAPCQSCGTVLQGAVGKGCRKCGYSGISGYTEKITVFNY